METATKRCTRCGEEKPASDFHKDSTNTKDGLQSACKICKKEEFRVIRVRRIEAAKSLVITEKKCNRCNQTKLIEAFGKNDMTVDGFTARCKVCNKENRLRLLAINVETRKTNPPTVKTCRRCRQEQPAENFPLDRIRKDGLYPFCNTCTKILKDETKDERRDYMLRYSHNISALEYSKMLVAQNGRCAICKAPAEECDRGLHVDHNHVTGQIRGLLCGKCNVAVGMLGDSEARAMDAANYLRYYNGIEKQNKPSLSKET